MKPSDLSVCHRRVVMNKTAFFFLEREKGKGVECKLEIREHLFIDAT